MYFFNASVIIDSLILCMKLCASQLFCIISTFYITYKHIFIKY